MAIQIIGIGGTNGAGKDLIGAILMRDHNWLFVSVTDMLRDELRKRGDPVDREHLRSLSAEWRSSDGLGVLVDKSVTLFEQTPGYNGLVLASIRNPYEVDRIHELGGHVWWVDADPRLRYDRIQANAAARGRSGEDQKSFEEFQAEEAAEMFGNGQATGLDMSAVKAKCDSTLLNESADVAVLARAVAVKLADYN